MGLLEVHHYLLYDLADPRLKNDFLVATPWPVITIICIYLYFVKILGPWFMKNREPYNIEWLIKVYNFVQIMWNLHIFFYLFRIAFVAKNTDNFNWWCFPVSDSGDSLSMVLLHGSRHYYYNKLFDLFDTVFFILRKKFNQVTYLHVYHHAGMCFAVWLGVKYGPGGNSATGGILNALIHVLMYTYYQFALLGYDVWWKRYLTQLQIIQFAVVFIHNVAVFFVKSCSYNLLISTLSIGQSAYFFYLFIRYYLRAYQKQIKTN